MGYNHEQKRFCSFFGLSAISGYQPALENPHHPARCLMALDMHADIHGKDVFAMSTLNPRINPASQRRSQRILLSVQLEVSGERANGSAFSENTATLVVNAHGALIQLREPAVVGQSLLMKNIVTAESVSCVVRDVGTASAGVTEVGVEFAEPRPRFWRVTFPPPDWSPRSPEAKRFASPAAVAKADK
jgi:hypothetical protein